jgi:tight adherence protein C
MNGLGIVFGMVAIVGGGWAMATAWSRSRRLSTDVLGYFDELEGEKVVDEFQSKLAEPLHKRVMRGVAVGGLGWLERLMPSSYVAKVELKLQLAGAAGATGPTEFIVGQVTLTAVLTAAAIGYVRLASPSHRMGLMTLVMLPLVGAVLPIARLNRRVTERKEAIVNDLPDTLDLLAISVEAGMGFEGALDVVCQYFHSPLAEEFSLTLREMELGLPRRDAFQNLKARTDVPALSNFVLAILQADALGIPIGRVLKTQATEMRLQRRMWAREKAAKLPVKILFPMVLFIFPPIMAVLLAPAAGSISRGLK